MVWFCPARIPRLRCSPPLGSRLRRLWSVLEYRQEIVCRLFRTTRFHTASARTCLRIGGIGRCLGTPSLSRLCSSPRRCDSQSSAEVLGIRIWSILSGQLCCLGSPLAHRCRLGSRSWELCSRAYPGRLATKLWTKGQSWSGRGRVASSENGIALDHRLALRIANPLRRSTFATTRLNRGDWGSGARLEMGWRRTTNRKRNQANGRVKFCNTLKPCQESIEFLCRNQWTGKKELLRGIPYVIGSFLATQHYRLVPFVNHHFHLGSVWQVLALWTWPIAHCASILHFRGTPAAWTFGLVCICLGLLEEPDIENDRTRHSRCIIQHSLCLSFRSFCKRLVARGAQQHRIHLRACQRALFHSLLDTYCLPGFTESFYLVLCCHCRKQTSWLTHSSFASNRTIWLCKELQIRPLLHRTHLLWDPLELADSSGLAQHSWLTSLSRHGYQMTFSTAIFHSLQYLPTFWSTEFDYWLIYYSISQFDEPVLSTLMLFLVTYSLVLIMTTTPQLCAVSVH